VYETLLSLFENRTRTLLDAGCGTGKVTLSLIDRLDRADAVDPSVEMLRVAHSLPSAANPKIRWINSTIEDASLDPPYGLIVAALSIHWMNLDRVMPKFAAALAPGAFLAILDGDSEIDAPWEREANAFMSDFVENLESKRHFAWKSAREQLNQPKLLHPRFQAVGFRITAPIEISQTIPHYLRCQHSRATWSEDHLGEQASAAFDAKMTEILTPHAVNGVLHFKVQTRIEWGHVIA
jgi:trans-aconitate methyltransferase